jgi:hypothetical protein
MMRALTSTAAFKEQRAVQALLKKSIIAAKSNISHTVFSQINQSIKSNNPKIIMPEGRESPPPERQSGRQLQDPTGSGKASNVSKTNETDPNHQLDVSEHQAIHFIAH